MYNILVFYVANVCICQRIDSIHTFAAPIREIILRSHGGRIGIGSGRLPVRFVPLRILFSYDAIIERMNGRNDILRQCKKKCMHVYVCMYCMCALQGNDLAHLLLICLPCSLCSLFEGDSQNAFIRKGLHSSRSALNITESSAAACSVEPPPAAALLLPLSLLPLLLSTTAVDDVAPSVAPPPLSCVASVPAAAAAGSAGITISAGGAVPTGGDQAP